MYRTYVALLHKANKKSAPFGVIFPDFPGCIASGKTMDKAVGNARKALVFHMEGMFDASEPIPKLTSLEEILKNPENKTAIPALIRIVVLSGHIKRLNISMDQGLLTEVDKAAKLTGRNRSEFLADAVKQALG